MPKYGIENPSPIHNTSLHIISNDVVLTLKSEVGRTLMCDITVTISCNEIIAVTTNDRRAVIKGSVVMTGLTPFPALSLKCILTPLRTGTSQFILHI